jgi:hypothetical protein
VLGGRAAGSAPRRRVALVAAALLVVGAAGAGALAYAQRDRSPGDAAIGSGPRSSTSAPPRSTTTMRPVSTTIRTTTACPAIGYPIVDDPLDQEHAWSGERFVSVDDRSATVEIVGGASAQPSFTVRTEAVSPYGTTAIAPLPTNNVTTGDGVLPGLRSVDTSDGRRTTTVTWTFRDTSFTATGIDLTDAQIDALLARTRFGTEAEFSGNTNPPICVADDPGSSTEPTTPATDRTPTSGSPATTPSSEPATTGTTGNATTAPTTDRTTDPIDPSDPYATSAPTEAARATVERVAVVPTGFQDCGRTAADSGWPTTMPPSPYASTCLRTALDAGSAAVDTITGRTGSGGALVTRYRVESGVAVIENWTIDPDGSDQRTESPCTPPAGTWYLTIGATSC